MPSATGCWGARPAPSTGSARAVPRCVNRSSSYFASNFIGLESLRDSGQADMALSGDGRPAVVRGLWWRGSGACRDAATDQGRAPALRVKFCARGRQDMTDSLASMDKDLLAINTIRTLAMDAVQKANSGHPGTPMALAPVAYELWN